MSKHTLKIRKVAGAKAEEFTVEKPEDCSDPSWKEMVEGSVPEAVSELAFQMWVIKAQAAYRISGTLPKDYVYGAKQAAGVKPAVIDCETFPWPSDEALAKEQMAYFRRAKHQKDEAVKAFILINEEAFPF